MNNKVSTLPLATGAIVIALIAGVTGWLMHPRTGLVPEQSASHWVRPAQIEERARPAPHRAPLAPVAPSIQDFVAIQAANDEAVTKLAQAGEQKLRTRYESERVDAPWASRKQQALERLSLSPQIEELNAQPLSIDAHCRASVCLIDANFPSRVAADDWYTLYTLNAGTEMFASSSNGALNPDGSVHLQIYGLARQ